MKIISTVGIRCNVYKPDPGKHMSSQNSDAHNFQEEKQQVKNYYAETLRIWELEAMTDI